MRTGSMVLILLVLATAAAAGHPFDQPFTLGVDDSLALGDDIVIVGFDSILGDSRCPTGVWCFWEGDAAAQFWLATPGDDPQVFVLHTHDMFDQSIVLGDFTIHLQLVMPYPDINFPIDPSTYVVTLLVHQSTVSAGESTWGALKIRYR